MNRKRGLTAPMICRIEDRMQGKYCAMTSANSEYYSICKNSMTSYFSICHMHTEICKFKDINTDVVRITKDIDGMIKNVDKITKDINEITENVNKITGSKNNK